MNYLVIQYETGSNSQTLLGSYTQKRLAKEHKHRRKFDHMNDAMEVRSVLEETSYLLYTNDTGARTTSITDACKTESEAETAKQNAIEQTNDETNVWYEPVSFDTSLPSITVCYQLDINTNNIGGDLPEHISNPSEWTEDFEDIVEMVSTIQDEAEWIGRGSLQIYGKKKGTSEPKQKATIYVSDMPTYPTDLPWTTIR
jgi:hypothetical protein